MRTGGGRGGGAAAQGTATEPGVSVPLGAPGGTVVPADHRLGDCAGTLLSCLWGNFWRRHMRLVDI